MNKLMLKLVFILVMFSTLLTSGCSGYVGYTNGAQPVGYVVL